MFDYVKLFLKIYDLMYVRKIKGLCDLAKLQTLHITRCIEVELFRTETLISLENFVANGCMKLKTI